MRYKTLSFQYSGYFFFSKDFEIYEEMLPIHGLKKTELMVRDDGASYIYQGITPRYTNFSFCNN